RTHPQAKTNLKILNVKSAGELAEVAASLGLAQNLAALKALSTEGIQRGHMELHARNIAISAGVPSEIADKVAEIMIKNKKINTEYAKEIFEKIK
ncbi:MAG: 3-hydroxy-3-methylglutaryl-CoA reductase, partial [Candidatus Altiarchaeales archaeon HGW-Altiarchaeales-2]